MTTQDPLKIVSNNLRILPYTYKTKQFRELELQQFAKRKNIIYGAQSIKKQLGIRGRPTYDFDIFSNNPKKDAYAIERQLEKIAPNTDLFYVKPALHYGTFKIMFKGKDLIKNSKDDVGLIDLSKKEGIIKYIKIENNLYRILQQELKAKLKALKDPTQKFRWKKDNDDAIRIKNYLNKFNKKIYK